MFFIDVKFSFFKMYKNQRKNENILIDSYYFRNADITFQNKYRMSCIVRNGIYATI